MINYARHKGTLEKIGEHFKVAVTRFEQGRNALYDREGKLLYSVAEHNKRWRDLAKNLKEAGANAHKEIEGINTAIETLLKANYGNPLLQFHDSVSLNEINSKLNIIKDSAENSPLADLANEVEAASLHGMPGRKAMYAVFGKRRLSKEREKYMQTGKVDPALAAFEAALSRLTADDPDPKEDMKIAQEIKDEGGKLTVRINSLLYDLVDKVEGERSWVQSQF